MLAGGQLGAGGRARGLTRGHAGRRARRLLLLAAAYDARTDTSGLLVAVQYLGHAAVRDLEQPADLARSRPAHVELDDLASLGHRQRAPVDEEAAELVVAPLARPEHLRVSGGHGDRDLVRVVLLLLLLLLLVLLLVVVLLLELMVVRLQVVAGRVALVWIHLCGSFVQPHLDTDWPPRMRPNRLSSGRARAHAHWAAPSQRRAAPDAASERGQTGPPAHKVQVRARFGQVAAIGRRHVKEKNGGEI